MNRAVLIGSLGCFVDSYDLVLFSTLRISSLQAIGVPSERIVDVGINLLNLQMLGMLLGGLMWGSLGDRRGRVSVLFGSIFLYSVATLSNGFVSSVWMYGILRFFAGLGLAGELGAAVTLVSEKMSPTERGWGTTLIAFMGAVGGLFAALTAEWFNWRTSYILGGLMGFALFGMRIRMSDSKLFETMRAKKVHRGNLLKIIFPRQRFFKVLTFVFIGLPIWYVVGILISFSPEIGASLGTREILSVPRALFFAQIGAFAGDLASGTLSHLFTSRKKVLLIFVLASAVLCAIFLGLLPYLPEEFIGLLYLLLGFTNGYWAVFVTVVAESFGTNLRSTVATSVPNLVRGSSLLLTFGLKTLRPVLGTGMSTIAMGVISFSLAILGIMRLEDSFAKDLNYLED